MSKIWKPTGVKSDKLILINNQTIYKGNPAREKLNTISLQWENTNTSDIEKELFSIPYSYIKKIINQKGVQHLKIFFGNDSEEEIKIESENTKDEIFNFLKNDIQLLQYKSELPSIFSYCKTQLFAILLLTGVFLWSMYYAVELEQGTEFELRGGGRMGIGGLVFMLGNLGTTKLILGYTTVLGLTILSMFRKLKTRTERQILYRS